MAVKEFPAGTQLIQSEQNQTGLHVIAKGSVCASYPGGTFYLKKGDVIGVCEIFFGSHFITYETPGLPLIRARLHSSHCLCQKAWIWRI